VAETRTRPVAVAITGGIGAGKSELLQAFARQGAATISSDEIVHALLRQPDVREAVVAELGPRVLGEDGEIDRSKVAERVFRRQDKLQWLEGLLHPHVVQTYLSWREGLADLEDSPAVSVTEVPLLYEVGGETRFDKVVVVTAPAEVRAARLGRSVSDREERLIPDEEKVARADFVYVNEGSLEDLERFASDVVATLSRST
jgi:dephospho-CoA kinase